MINYLSGAVTLAYVVAAIYFLQFWRRSSERLFVAFAIAFALLALNQLTTFVLGSTDERGNYAYVLRVLAFVLILIGIVAKNVSDTERTRS